MSDNHERVIVPVLNSSHSTVKIDSLCIKLGIMKEKDDVQKCRHFSIRGYVAGMREKGKRNLLPFAEELPPMDIPNFRYWLCEKCLQNNETANASIETALISWCDQCVFSPSARSSQQQDTNGVAVLPFGEGTSGLEPVDSKNPDETILAALEADESQSCQEIPDRVEVPREGTKVSAADTNAESKDDENPGISQAAIENGHPRRKTRKVRLLKELLCGNSEQKNDCSSSLPPSQIKRKIADDHDHEHPKKAKPKNVVEEPRNPEFGENINKSEWNKQRSCSDAWRSIFSGVGNRSPPKSRVTEAYPNLMKSSKRSSNPIKSIEEDSRKMKDDVGLDLSLNYGPQSHLPPNTRKSGFFLGESSNFPHTRIQPRSVIHTRLYSQLPYGSCSGHHKLNFSDPYKRNIRVGGYSEFTRPNNHQLPERVFSIGRSDEREIIELMAKNQYERNLCEANNGIISGFHKPMNEGMAPSHHEYLTMIRPPSASTSKSENAGPMRNPGGFFHQDRVSSFTINQKRPLNCAWMSDSGPQGHYESRYHYASNGNSKKPQTHVYSPTNMQVLEAFNQYSNGTLQHEPANVQFGRTYAKYSDNDKGKSMMNLDLNLMAPNVVEEQNNFESFDLNPTRVCSFDSSYSNETIPAMQLLSLMDAGKLSQPFNLTGQTCVTKPKTNSCFSHCSSTLTDKTNPIINPIGSPHSSLFRTGQNTKLTTTPSQEVKLRGASLASVGCRPEDSYVFPLPWQANESQTKIVNRAFGPWFDSSRTKICTINRNPADFSTPGPENMYMINVEDLVFNRERENSQKKAIKPAS